MVIRRMNSVFRRHNRFLFSVITLVIIVTFVGFFTPGFMSLFSDISGSNNAGTVLGHKISYEDIRKYGDNQALFVSLQYGMDPRAMREMSQARAFEYLAWKLAAYDMGIRVSDSEIVDFLKGLQIFRGESGFSLAKYDMYVKNVLHPSGFNKQDMDSAVKEGLFIDKVFKQIAAEVIVTPGEIRNFFDSAQEKFEIRVAKFKAEDFKKEIKLEEKELTSYFEANRQNYMTSPRFKVSVVRFNYNDYEREAHKKITDELVKKYYENNKKEFVTKDNKPMSFEEASKKIKADLLIENEKELALRDAKIFAAEAYTKTEDAEDNKAEAFEIFAKEKKNNVYKTNWFSAESKKIEGVGEEPELVKGVASTYDKVPVSDAIAGKKAVFVSYLLEYEKPKEAALADVRAKVEEDLVKIQATKLAKDKAREFASKIAEAPDKYKFIESAKAVKFEKIEPFVAMMPPQSKTNEGQLLAAVAGNTSVGNASAAIDLENYSIIVFVDKRTLPKEEDFEKQFQTISDVLHRQKVQAATEDFGMWLNNHSKKTVKAK